MTDLERADALLYALLTEDDAPRQEAMLARVLAAARREGAEQARRRLLYDEEGAIESAYRQGAEEMRERAARVCEGGYTTGSTASTLEAVAAAIRALKNRA